MNNTTKDIEFDTEEQALAYAEAWCKRSVVGATHCYAWASQCTHTGKWWVRRTKHYLS
jgi:hypothetical protein